MMNRKDKNSYCLKTDIMERCFSNALEGNAAYTWLFLSKETQAMSKLGSSTVHLRMETFKDCFNPIFWPFNPTTTPLMIPPCLQNEV